MQQDDLIAKIKEKRELSGLSDSIINDYLNKTLKKYSISLENLNNSDKKIIIKEVRADLRRLSGMFQTSKDKNKLLKKNNIKEILRNHTSTSERLEFYPSLKKRIRKLKPNSILDLGCGINPIALASREVKYYASDINEKDLSLIEKFFKKNRIEGKTFFYNLEKINNDLPSADLCLAFKVLDIVRNRLGVAEKILTRVNCKNFLLSFSTKKLSGKRMNKPKRIWFERILKKNNLNYLTFSSENEVFYLVRKG